MYVIELDKSYGDYYERIAEDTWQSTTNLSKATKFDTKDEALFAIADLQIRFMHRDADAVEVF